MDDSAESRKPSLLFLCLNPHRYHKEARFLKSRKFEVEFVTTTVDLIDLLPNRDVNYAFIAIDHPQGRSPKFLQAIAAGGVTVIPFAEEADPITISQLESLGDAPYLLPPLSGNEIIQLVTRLERYRAHKEKSFRLRQVGAAAEENGADARTFRATPAGLKVYEIHSDSQAGDRGRFQFRSAETLRHLRVINFRKDAHHTRAVIVSASSLEAEPRAWRACADQVIHMARERGYELWGDPVEFSVPEIHPETWKRFKANRTEVHGLEFDVILFKDESFRWPIQVGPRQDFLSVSCEALRAPLPAPNDFYILLKRNERYVKYLRKGAVLTEERYKSLESHGHRQFHFAAHERAKVEAFLTERDMRDRFADGPPV